MTNKAGQGRKHAISEGIISQLANFIILGMTIKDAVTLCHITEATYYRWVKLSKALAEDEDTPTTDEAITLPTKPIRANGEATRAYKRRLAEYEATIALYRQFSPRMELAFAQCKLGLVSSVMTASDNDAKLALEVLSRKYPNEWGRQKTAWEEGEINLNITLNKEKKEPSQS